MASQTIDAEVLRTLGLGRHARRKRWIKRGIYLVLALAAASAAFLLWRRAHQVTPVRYQTAVVERADLSVSVTATGTLEPATSVEVGPEISGRVLRVLADYNDHVEAGQILVVLDTELLSAQAAQADAQVALAQANQRQAAEALAEARRIVARDQPLGERGVISAAQLDAEHSAMVKAVAAEGAAAAQVRASRAAAAVVHTSLSKATIRAPIAGVVLTRSVEEGQAVVAALQAPVFFELARDLDRMQLNLLLDSGKGVAKDVRARTLARLRKDLRGVPVILGLLTRPPRDFLDARRSRLVARRGLDAAAIERRLADRDAARKAKDFKLSDEIRAELKALGVEVMDGPTGATWRVVD